MRRKDCTEYELVLSRMSVLERQIMGRAGQWELKNGKWWDNGLDAYVLKCACCKHHFLSNRSDKKTCSEKCKKARQRSNARANLTKRQHDQQTSF
jgi:hypothetical protein